MARPHVSLAVRAHALFLALAAAAYSAGRLVHERRLTTRIADLPGTHARDLHERGRQIHDRILWAIALACALGAISLWVYVLVLLPRSA